MLGHLYPFQHFYLFIICKTIGMFDCIVYRYIFTPILRKWLSKGKYLFIGTAQNRTDGQTPLLEPRRVDWLCNIYSNRPLCTGMRGDEAHFTGSLSRKTQRMSFISWAVLTSERRWPLPYAYRVCSCLFPECPGQKDEPEKSLKVTKHDQLLKNDSISVKAHLCRGQE